MKEQVDKALEVLKSGGTILYPTDTIWGIGCDATNANAVQKIYAIKKRENSKSLITLLDKDVWLPDYADIPDIAYDLIEMSERPLTIIYPNARKVAKNVISEDGSISIRVVKHPFCEQLIYRFRKAIVSTSANISGMPAPKCFTDISEDIVNAVDYVVNLDQNIHVPGDPSGIIKLGMDNSVQVIRE